MYAGKQILLCLLCCLGARAQDSVRISLADAREQAVQQSKLLQIQRAKVKESEYKISGVHSKYFPNLSATAGYVYNVKTDITLREGKLGNINNTPIPDRDIKLFEGNHNLLLGGVTAIQPITQLTKVAVGEKVARTEAGIARTQLDKASLEIKQGVEKLYFGLLITQQQLTQAQAETEMLNAQLYDIESALMAGKTDSVNRTGLLARLADEEQKTLQLGYQYQDYQDDLDELLGYPPATPIAPLPVTDTLYTLQPLSAYVAQAGEQNPDVRIASQTRDKATFGVAAARKDFIPDLGLAGGYGYQNAISLLPENNFFVGVILHWNILDFGGRRAVVNERLSLRQQADTNLVYTKEHTTIAVQKAYRNVQQSLALIQVAQKAVRYRREELKMKEDARLAGTLLKREVLATQADLAKALADLYAAQLNYRMAITALSMVTGN